MIPWIQVYSNLPTHPKTARLADELKLTGSSVSPAIIATGILIGLWAWAIQNAYDGNLANCSISAIADACRWKKKPQTLVDALKAAGYLDEDMKLHDWEEYALLLIDAEDNRKRNDAERSKKYRELRKASRDGHVTNDKKECDASRDFFVTSHPNHAPTIPYHTVPDQTKEVSLDNIIKKEKEKQEKEKQEKETEKVEKGVSVENPVENSFESKKAATIAALKNIDEKGHVPYAREVMCNASP